MKKQDMDKLELFAFRELGKPKKMIYRKNLEPINNLKIIFREIRDYVAGNVTGISRDEKIAQNIMRLLFCKIFDEKTKEESELVDFANRPDETEREFSLRINRLFENVKTRYPDIFEAEEKIEIENTGDLSHIVSKFEDYCILDADRDVLSDAFEEFIGTSFRGSEGQFFTPRNVVQMMIDVLEPKSNERILDPACGSGGFLVYVLKHMIKKKESDYFLCGIDKDLFLSRLAKIYLTLIGEEKYHIFCENSLALPSSWGKKEAQEQASLCSFDLILTNPPFGAKIPVVGRDLLRQYQLGYQWNHVQREWVRTKNLLSKQPPQILFIERCLQFLKEGGRMGIVLPEGLFGNPSDRYIWEYISQNASIIGLVSLSHETFQPSTHTKTSVLFLEKKNHTKKKIFMAIANSVGHDKNGKEVCRINKDGSYVLDKKGNIIVDDDLPEIALMFRQFLCNKRVEESHISFSVDYSKLNDNIFIPEYYNPEIKHDLLKLEKDRKYELIRVRDLIDNGTIKINRVNEIGSRFYGTGEVPFVRTTDIVNWEIKMDPIKAVSNEVYEQYKKIQDVQENDILFVNDGTFLIGRTAIITSLDKKIIIQSHLRKIRVSRGEEINPYYLFYLLNTSIVQRQIKAKTFIQATISTLGNRLNEVILPIGNSKEIENITRKIKGIIEEKMILRRKSVELIAKSV